MQLMTWMVGRLGSRFGLLFEPYRRRVMHSALGRFLDQPLDLMVGLVEPDGVERVLPFTARGTDLLNPEQFERLNSITFRGLSEKYGLRFEFNVHSVFYPQDERLCIMPAIYLEMRVTPAPRIRWSTPKGPPPSKVKLFLRLRRPGTKIGASVNAQGAGLIDLEYRNTLKPEYEPAATERLADGMPSVAVRERIVSLNTEPCVPDGDGMGLTLELPVSEAGSGIKWRLIWGAYCDEPVLEFGSPDRAKNAPDPTRRLGRFRYTRHWKNLDEVIDEAVATRDDRLAHSRRIEKIAEQAPLRNAERHLLAQSFQAYLSNTWWCDTRPADAPDAEPAEWFSTWEGNTFNHGTLDVEYNHAPFYLSIWPRLLKIQFAQWAAHATAHRASGGVYLHHDMGAGTRVAGQAFPYEMPVEENSNFLLLLQAYSHVTGDLEPARQHVDLIDKLGRYLLWTDRDKSGFPSEGVANSFVDAGPALNFARKQTYLAVKRAAALAAVSDLLTHLSGKQGLDERLQKTSEACETAAEAAPDKIDSAAWIGDHYAICVDTTTTGLIHPLTRQPLMADQVPHADAYSIHTANGLLLPIIAGQPPLLNSQHLLADITAAIRESLGPYGCGHSSAELDAVWVSQNLWRDMIARYLGVHYLSWTPNYWDLQVMSNTHQQSLGCCDTYTQNNLCFYPRPITSIGLFLAYPRLVIDRLAPGGARISVDPDRDYPQRWPLFPLADWKAGKVPICVVNNRGQVHIEGESDPIIVRGEPMESGIIG